MMMKGLQWLAVVGVLARNCLLAYLSPIFFYLPSLHTSRQMMALANVAARLRLPRAIVLDLRTEAELTTAPAVCNVLGLNVATTDEVPGAIEAAVKSGQLPDKFAPIIVYCRYGPCSGRRAGVACEMLLQLGFFIVANGGSRETMATSCKMAGATASPNRILFSSRH